VACNKSSEIAEIDTRDWKILRRIPAGPGVYNLGVTHDGKKLLGTNKRDQSVSVIDVATGKELARIQTTRKVVHGVAISDDDRYAFITIEGTGEYVGAWTPWATTSELPDGAGVRLPARARLAIDVLYQGSDAPVTDTPRIGLYVTRAPSQSLETTTLTASKAQFTAAADIRAVALRVDMAPGARSIEVRAMQPDGAIEPLLLVRDYRPEWQTPFVFATPKLLPRGTVVQAIAHFDEAARDRQFTVSLASLIARAPLPRATTPSR
jgi:YVTN family beta-propeller protein